MSLVRLGVRIAAVMAITDATFAEDRVYDSEILSIDTLVSKDPKPFITVTTDDDETDVTGRDLLSGNRSLDLVIECIFAGKLDGETVSIPETDAGMEITLDLMQRQVTRALSSEENVWSLDFKKLAVIITKMASRRGASAENGVRFAARQIVLTIDPMNDPDYGVALDDEHPLKKLADNLTAKGGEYVNIANLIISEAAGTLIPDWDRVRTDLSMMKSAAAAIRVGDYIEGEAGDTLTEIEVENETIVMKHIINEANAEDQDPTT